MYSGLSGSSSEGLAEFRNCHPQTVVEVPHGIVRPDPVANFFAGYDFAGVFQ